MLLHIYVCEHTHINMKHEIMIILIVIIIMINIILLVFMLLNI